MTAPNFWTPSKIERLIELWQSRGLSVVAIAKDLGTTRNSVSGKIHRLKLPCRIKPIRKKANLVLIKARARGLRRWRSHQAGIRQLVPKLRFIGVEVPLLKREPSQCAYLVGHHLMCGAPTLKIRDRHGHVKNSSYCDYHWHRCYYQGKDKNG